MTLTMKGCYTVKPAEPTPNIKISLSESDQINPITHAPTIYFYRPSSTDYPFPSAIETLKTSLSQLLVHFYPLAGRLQLTNDGDRLEIECNSMGAQLYEAESEAKIDDYGDFRPTPELRKLIPVVDYTKPIHELPVLLVQLTKFRCGGMSLGIAISHSVVDGAAALHFIAEWARIARGLPLELVPFLDRVTPWEVTDHQVPQPAGMLPKFDHTEFSPLPLLIGQPDNMEERGKESDVAMLKLTKTDIERIKNKANDGHREDNINVSNRRPYSRFEAVSGHIWRCASKAREHESQQLTYLRTSADARNRVNPPLPKGYFGNAVYLTMATSSSGDLIDKPLGYASSRVREAVEKMTDEYIRSAIDLSRTQKDMSKFRIYHTLGCTKGNFFGNPNINVTTWISLPLYGADFGWGKEIYMGPGAIGFDGKYFILPGRDGDGSFVIALRMQVAHLDSFKKFFYEDI